MSKYWLSYFFLIMGEERGGEGEKSQRTRRLIKPQGQGQLSARNNKAKVVGQKKKTSAKVKAMRQRARKWQLNHPPIFGGLLETSPFFLGGGGGLVKATPASARAQPKSTHTPPPRSMAKVSQVPARAQPPKKYTQFKKKENYTRVTHTQAYIGLLKATEGLGLTTSNGQITPRHLRFVRV